MSIRSFRSFLTHRFKQGRSLIPIGVFLACLLAILFFCERTIRDAFFSEVNLEQDPIDDLAPIFDISVRIAYISRHPGTTVDFRYMAEHLQLENVDYYDAAEAFDVYAQAEAYREQVTSGEVEKFCSTYDAIFISDKLLDGWPFIMDGEQPCRNVFFVVTNRFDVLAPVGAGHEAYVRDFNRSLNRDDEYRAKIIVNNAFEVPYMNNRGVDSPAYRPLIRPFGYSPLPAAEVNAEDINAPCLIISRNEQDKFLMTNLVRQHTSHECKVLGSHYGGPRTLSLYRSIVVHLPYQVSVMKMWENLAHGVLMIVPSPKFFSQICNENDCTHVEDVFKTKKIIGEGTWYKYVDFYLSGWEKCFLTFDSWDELDKILTARDYIHNINYCRDKIEDLRELGLKSWKEVLLNLE